MGRADEYERTLLKVAEILRGFFDGTSEYSSKAWDYARVARLCEKVVEGENLEAAIWGSQVE